MKDGGIPQAGPEYNHYANGNMQHVYNNSRQTPDSGLGNDMNNAANAAGGGGGDNNGGPAAGGGPSAPPGFQQQQYYGGPQLHQQQQYNEQQYRPKPYEGGRFDRSNGPPSLVTMHTTPPNMDQDGAPSYAQPNFYPPYGNQGGPPPHMQQHNYGGNMDRNYNPVHHHPMATRSHSNFSESSSVNLTSGGGGGGMPDHQMLSGQPLMAGPPGGLMYHQGGPAHQTGGPAANPGAPPHLQYAGGMQPVQQMHPQMQHAQQFMVNPAMAAAAAAQHAASQHQMMVQGPSGMVPAQGMPLQQGGPQQPPMGGVVQQMQQQQPGGGGPPLSVTPPQGMVMMGGPGMHHPGQTVYFNQHQQQPQHPMMAHRGPMVGQDGFVQFNYAANPAAAAASQQGGYVHQQQMRGVLQQQRSLNSPAPSDNTDAASSIQGGIGMWTGPPDQQQPPQQPQMQHMQQGMMQMQPHPMMVASYPGGFVPQRMGPGPTGYAVPMQQMPMGPGMIPPQMHQMQQYPQHQFAHQQQTGGQQQAQTGYWQNPQGRGGYRGARGGGMGRGGGGGGYRGGERPNSRQSGYTSRYQQNTTMGGRREEEESKSQAEDEIDVTGLSQQMEESSLRVEGGGGEGQRGGQPESPRKQLLELADSKTSSSPPAEPHPSEDVVEDSLPLPTTPRAEPRKELLEVKKTPKHQVDKSQSIPVDPIPPLATDAAAAGQRKWSEVASKPCCVFCKGRGRSVDEYSTHNVRDLSTGAVTCPLFQSIGCSYCGVKGEHAHDAFFCEKRKMDEEEARLQQQYHETSAAGEHHAAGYQVGYAAEGGAYRGGQHQHQNQQQHKKGGYNKARGGDRKQEGRRVQ